MACLLAICLTACHKEEQEVAGAAENAVQAEHKAQAAAQASASEQDRERAELALIPLPTKSMYVNVRDAGAWANPFLSVGASSLSLRISVTGANPGTAGQAGGSHTKSAHYHEVQLRPADLAQALIALPPGAESPLASRKDRPQVRRNLEAAIQQLNDLGIVVEEWPAR